MSGNFHAGSEVASYPWDDSALHKRFGYESQAPDSKFFKVNLDRYYKQYKNFDLNWVMAKLRLSVLC